MNIEKSLEIVKGKLLMIKKLLKNDEENGHSSSYEMQEEDFEAIETLLTAYEKEKEKNKELQELYTGALQDWGNEKEKNKELEKKLDEISEIHFPIIY